MSNSQRYWSIDDFDVGDVIGEGRFGKVFVAREKKSRFVCVLKIIRKKLLTKHNLEKQLISEIGLHSSFNHPNILRLYGYFFDDERIMMILEYAAHGTLSNLLKKHTKFDEPTAAKYFKQILSAVEHIHSKEVLHRDLKPSNIMISLDNTLLLGDFGFAIKGNAPAGEIVGTLDYISPEILNNKEYGRSADVWALGSILFELLTGKCPFESDDPKETVRKIQNAEFSFPDYISPLARKLISSILQIDPTSRPTAKDLLNDPWITFHTSLNNS